MIRAALRRVDGNVTRAAQLLHMSRDTLRHRIQKHDLSDYLGDFTQELGIDIPECCSNYPYSMALHSPSGLTSASPTPEEIPRATGTVTGLSCVDPRMIFSSDGTRRTPITLSSTIIMTTEVTPKIIAYLNPMCPWTHGVLTFLKARDLAFEYRDIISDAGQYEEMVSKSGQYSSPCVEVNGYMLADVGGDEVEHWMQQQGLI